MTNREQIMARSDRILADLRERRDERADRCLELLAEIQQKLAWRRANGYGYWLGPASRFKSPDIETEIPLFYCTVDPLSMN